MEEKYTILFTEYHFGNITIVVDKDKVRKECERIKSMSKLANENAYMRIEVVNNQTGEIREYWNNHDNKIMF